MANHTTGAQRRNARMDKIFERAKSEGRGLVSDSKSKGYGVNSPAMMEARKGFAKSKALESAKGGSLIERHNRAVAKRDEGKTKEQMSNDAFKSGRTSGRY